MYKTVLEDHKLVLKAGTKVNISGFGFYELETDYPLHKFLLDFFHRKFPELHLYEEAEILGHFFLDASRDDGLYFSHQFFD